jgi:hypothetical protein
MHTITKRQGKSGRIDVKALVGADAGVSVGVSID